MDSPMNNGMKNCMFDNYLQFPKERPNWEHTQGTFVLVHVKPI